MKRRFFEKIRERIKFFDEISTDSRYWTSWVLVLVVAHKFWVMRREMRKMVKEDLIGMFKGLRGCLVSFFCFICYLEMNEGISIKGNLEKPFLFKILIKNEILAVFEIMKRIF